MSIRYPSTAFNMLNCFNIISDILCNINNDSVASAVLVRVLFPFSIHAFLQQLKNLGEKIPQIVRHNFLAFDYGIRIVKAVGSLNPQ